MYNLIITSSAYTSEKGVVWLDDINRFGEFTIAEIFDKKSGEISTELLRSFAKLPTIIATEERDEVAFLAEIADFRLRSNDIEIRFGSPHPIPYRTLKDNQKELDIEDFEFSRNHWSIKNVDLRNIPDLRLAISASTATSFHPDQQRTSHADILSICYLARSACRDRKELLSSRRPNDPKKLQDHEIELQCLDSLIYSLDTFLTLDHMNEDDLEEYGQRFAESIIDCLIKFSETKTGEKITNTAIGTILLGISTGFSNYIPTELTTPLLFGGTFGHKLVSALKN